MSGCLGTIIVIVKVVEGGGVEGGAIVGCEVEAGFG